MARRRPRFTTLEQALGRIHPDLRDPRNAILRGDVLVDGIARTNPSSLVPRDASLALRRPTPLRGRSKLAFALDAFRVDACDRIALDVGAAAGGFTLALLDAGARCVYAVDAGHGQLRGSLRADPRVVNLEATNLAHLDRQLVPDRIDVVTFDLSYLALRDAAPQLDRVHLAGDADAIALIKPQFELHRRHLPASRQDLDDAALLASDGFTSAGWHVVGIVDSPWRGSGGAVELLLHAQRAG
jgi:23S rRNA (cytidine1920-2'-O)/16S rRNA (cytidine1409-2'-O)-methyltransferase